MVAAHGEGPDWATRVANEVRLQYADGPREMGLQSVRATSPQAVEVIYSWPGEETLRGIRLHLASVEAASWRIRASTAGELAFDLVAVGMQEPRPLEEFSEPDENGIRWLPTSAWLDP